MDRFAEEGPMNMYELQRSLRCSYALVHKSVRELAANRILYNYGKRKIERKPGKRKGAYKHPVTLWGLSIPGIWTLILVDKSILKKWRKIKDKYNELLGNSLNYFGLIVKIGIIGERYGHSTFHSFPNPKMVAQALIYAPTQNEEELVSYYNEFVEILKPYPRSASRRILQELKKEHNVLSGFLERCIMLRDKIEASMSMEVADAEHD
jgi:hypothetical protein